ncbi:hypothetical protein [Schleiferilactobacillus harbinensis]|nr:hypothetical protein [Schleiferilactobacillus harbinensis]
MAESKADDAGKVSFTIKGLKAGDELRITQLMAIMAPASRR